MCQKFRKSHYLESAKTWFEMNEKKLIFKSEKSLRKEFEKLVKAMQVYGLDTKSISSVFSMVKKWQLERLTKIARPFETKQLEQTFKSQPSTKKPKTNSPKKLLNLPFKYGK